MPKKLPLMSIESRDEKQTQVLWENPSSGTVQIFLIIFL